MTPLLTALCDPSLDALAAVEPGDAIDACRLATACAGLGEPRAGRHWLRRADELAAPRDVRAQAWIARVLRGPLAHPDEGARVIAACAGRLLRDRATTTAQWLALVEAWREHGDADAARDYLVHADACAQTTGELCAVATAQEALGIDLGIVRPTIARAAAVAATVHDVALVARCHDRLCQDLDAATAVLTARLALPSRGPLEPLVLAFAFDDLGDREAAARARAVAHAHASTPDAPLLLELGDPDHPWRPPGTSEWTTPAGRYPRFARLLDWSPEPTALFAWLCTQLTPAQRSMIASADYGMDADAHRFALDRIVATGGFMAPLDWEPHEVLALTRWSDGPGTDHIARAFATTVLALAGAEDDDRSVFAPLLESALALGTAATEAAVGLFAAFAESAGVKPFVELALALAATWLDPIDPRLPPLIDRMLRDEDAQRASGDEGFDQLGLRDSMWRRTARLAVLPHRATVPALDRLATRLGLR